MTALQIGGIGGHAVDAPMDEETELGLPPPAHAGIALGWGFRRADACEQAEECDTGEKSKNGGHEGGSGTEVGAAVRCLYIPASQGESSETQGGGIEQGRPTVGRPGSASTYSTLRRASGGAPESYVFGVPPGTPERSHGRV